MGVSRLKQKVEHMKAYRSLKSKRAPNQDERRRYADRILEALSGTNREAVWAFLKEKGAAGGQAHVHPPPGCVPRAAGELGSRNGEPGSWNSGARL